jgi:DNA-binding MarR family transcriptional regulator
MNRAIGDVTGLNRTDAQCLDIISRDGPITPGALAQRIGLTAGAVTTSLDRLASRSWIVRRHDTADRRRVLVELNEAKLGTFRGLFKGLQRATQVMSGEYSIDQLELIVGFLNRTAAMVANHRRSLKR